MCQKQEAPDVFQHLESPTQGGMEEKDTSGATAKVSGAGAGKKEVAGNCIASFSSPGLK